MLPFGTIGRRINSMTIGFQATDNKLADLLFIFHEQNAHIP
jgi:hypothetical protein